MPILLPMRTPAPDPAARQELSALSLDLREAFRAWGEDPSSWRPGRFESLAQRAFRLQYRANSLYRRYCDRRGRSPDAVGAWTEVPPVPTEAFRHVPLVVGGVDGGELEFRTSGTTRGEEARGRHLVPDAGLYRDSLLPPFRRFVLEAGSAGSGAVGDGGRGERPFCSLLPPFESSHGSSLAWMCDAVIQRFGTADSTWVAGREGFDWEAGRALLERACERGEAVCVLATTLAAAEWTERLEREGRSYSLPPGSVLMDTGGAKGRPGLERSEVVAAVEDMLGIPRSRTVNEFGMTELLSQRYAPTLPSGEVGGLEGPPWIRTRAVDPVTLEPVPEGEAGLLLHFDLANAGSVCAVLTEDLGRVRDGRVSYLGRAEAAVPRGCSLATAELLRSAETGGRGNGNGRAGGPG